MQRIMAENIGTIVETRKLCKVYHSPFRKRSTRALSELDLEIKRGEIFGLLGPNGSGKTTTIKLLLGLIRPTSGSVTVFNKPSRNVHVKHRIGFQPEESYLYRILNADETLDFYGRLFGMKRDIRRRRADELIKKLGLEKARTRPLSEYSKGMSRRIGLAQALINDPEFVILDEPTSGMDPIGTRQIKDLLLELKDQGKTILLSSHLLSEVETICDRIAILFQGKLKVCGKVKELLKRKDQVSITAENLSEDGVVSIRKAIETEGGEVLSIDTPNESLESLFLKVVQDAGP